MSTATPTAGHKRTSRRARRTRPTRRSSRRAAAHPAALQPAPATAAPGRATTPAAEASAYALDAWQRGILFLDTLRERADIMLRHQRAGTPPVLAFEHELVLDARSFEPPANYALLRIIEADGMCVADCLDESRPPVIVIDPRAGHGPGIGGFKRDSEVGIALQEGHPVYFVIFYPEPCHGQTLAHVLQALHRFVAHVRDRHQGKAPVVYGNCQAGWAATILAADCEGLSGPTVLNGSPLSYWAGERGVNPMRVLGGLLGGTWLARFLADLGDGEFDGAWLVQNFESLKPEAAIWDKYANLFTRVDTERERFLEFERWWNGFYRLSREEITAIVENLFVGNRLEEGRVHVCPGCRVDLKRIRNPMVVFASYGDNISPPHQALGWIPAVYESTEALKAAGQRIVYLTNPHVGHLGIFVSARVARFEHRAILESLDEIEALPPGLYEMKIDNPSADPDCRKPHYAVTFEERGVGDLRFDYDERAFERVRSLSELSDAAYQLFVSPWMRAAATPWNAALMRSLHPMRTSRLVFSEQLNPWMWPLAAIAGAVRAHRRCAPANNPYLGMERTGIENVSSAIEGARELRDHGLEQTFRLLYG